MPPRPPRSTLFPYTTLFRSTLVTGVNISASQLTSGSLVDDVAEALADSGLPPAQLVLELTVSSVALEDRKSTRLNSSHPSISYAVFCLKKKKNKYYMNYIKS